MELMMRGIVIGLLVAGCAASPKSGPTVSEKPVNARQSKAESYEEKSVAPGWKYGGTARILGVMVVVEATRHKLCSVTRHSRGTSTTREFECQKQPAPGATVTLGTVFSGKTDKHGRAMIFLARVDKNPEAAGMVRVNGAAAPSLQLRKYIANLRRVQLKRRKQAAQDARDAHLQKISDKEIAAGKCEPSRYKLLQTLAHRLRRQVKGLRSATLIVTDVDTPVATPAGVNARVNVGIEGEFHIFSFSFSYVEVIASDARGNVSTLPSVYTRFLGRAIGAEIGGVVLNGGLGSSVSVKGRGCTLVMVVRKL